MTAALTLDPATARGALTAVQEAMTALAEAAEVPLPDNVIDFAAAHRARRDRLRSGGAP